MAAAPSVAAPSGGFQNGGWYGGQQFVNGTWSDPGVINSQSNQQGAGQAVSSAVNQQSSVAQGKAPGAIDTFIANGATQPGNTNGSAGGGNPSQSANGNPGGGGLPTPSSMLGGSQPAVPNLSAVYDAAYTNNPNVKASQAKITDLQGQVTQRQQALDTATKNINDNPFYAEATRVGKVAQLNNDAQNDMKTLNDQLTTENANQANFQAEAQRQVNLSQGQYSLNNTAWQQNLQEFNTLMSAGALENASPQTLAGLSVSTGIPTDMLSSIATSEQAKNTQIVTSTDNNGNVTLTAVNSQTGKIVNQTKLGGVGAAKTTGGTKADTSTGLTAMTPKILGVLNSYGNISPQDWNTAQAAWMAAGLPKSDFVANYGQYADTNRGDFLSAYGFANPKTAATVKQNQAVNTKPLN